MPATTKKNLVFLILFISLLAGGCEGKVWREARRENTVEAYQEYLERYPRGKYSKSARKTIERISFNNAHREKTIKGFQRYLEDFPDGDLSKQARRQLHFLIKVAVNKFSLEQVEKARVMVETSLGKFSIRLFPGDAPAHSRNVLYLVFIGFYDGITIHRVQEGRLMQMGDPRGDGLGGPGYMIPMENSARPHVRGAVSMWHYFDEPDTGGSQFFICLKDLPELDGHFTVFGEVVEGWEVIEEISRVETTGVQRRPPFQPIEPVYIERMWVQGVELEQGKNPAADQ